MIYITHERSVGRTGHHFKDAISPLIVAEIFGFTYVYTEYKSLEFFNLREGRLSRRDLPEDISIKRIEGPYWLGIPFKELRSQFATLSLQDHDCLVVLANSFRIHLFQTYQWYKEGLLQDNVYACVVHSLRKNFRSRNPKHTALLPENGMEVAVHIRRGDLTNSSKSRIPSSQHYSHSMEYYDAILNKLKKRYRDRKLNIHIYTEHLNADDVVSYCERFPEIQLHQGARTEFAEHFCKMVYSDLLVVSNSSMSQMAGYLSEGIKIYYPNDQYHDLPPDEFVPVQNL